MPFPTKYHIPKPWGLHYARAKAQAKSRREDWAFTPETWYRHWKLSGVMQHRMRKIQGYCMVRVDRLEAWGPHNCIIVNRRQTLLKNLDRGPTRRKIDPVEWSEQDDVTPNHKKNRSFK